MFLKRFAVGVAALALTCFAPSGELTGTLKKIKETGVINIGYRETSIPFSYLDDDNKPVGLAMDICNLVVDKIKESLDLEKLDVKYVAVTSSTRIPLIANGTLDLECGSTTNNVERATQVSFANTHFLSAAKYVTKKASNINSIADLKGKTIISTAGTTSIKLANQRNIDENLGMNILSAKDHAEGFLAVETDRAAAFIMDDVLLASFVAQAKDPSLYVISEDTFSKPEPYGIAMPKDSQFKELVDAITSEVYKTKGVELYNKWFTQPIPPKNISLNLSISPELKNQFENPISSPDPDAYTKQ